MVRITTLSPQKKERKKYKVKRVSSWKDFPKPARESSVLGYSDPKTGNIWVRMDAPKSTLEHELYHSHKRHADFPRLYSDHIDHELEADMYAYKKIGQPVRIVGVLTGLFNTCIPYLKKKKCTASQVMSHIKRKLIELEASPVWMRDYNELVRRVRKSGWIKG